MSQKGRKPSINQESPSNASASLVTNKTVNILAPIILVTGQQSLSCFSLHEYTPMLMGLSVFLVSGAVGGVAVGTVSAAVYTAKLAAGEKKN